MSRGSVSVELKHAVTQKSISWSMVDGMRETEKSALNSFAKVRSLLGLLLQNLSLECTDVLTY